jgi:hypothetical protein
MLRNFPGTRGIPVISLTSLAFVLIWLGNARAQQKNFTITVTVTSTKPGTASYRKGDRVHILATYLATDTQDSTEGEPLELTTTTNDFSAPMQVNTTQQFDFVASADGVLTGTIPSGDNDEQAVLTLDIGRLDCAELEQEISTLTPQLSVLEDRLTTLKDEELGLEIQRAQLQFQLMGNCGGQDCSQIAKQLADVNQQLADNNAQQGPLRGDITRRQNQLDKLKELFDLNCSP